MYKALNCVWKSRGGKRSVVGWLKFFMPKQRRRGSSIAIMLVVFAVLLYMLIPLAKAAYEIVYFSHIRQRAIAMLDSAAFSSALALDSQAFSEKKVVLNEDKVKRYLVDDQGVIQPKNIWVYQRGDGICIGFEFELPQVFSQNEVTLHVEGNYDFEVLSTSVY